jgi:glycosyltransferase involved in cell wall biosynthesis
VYPHIDTSKIVVIHLGVSNFFFEPIQPLANNQKPYFVYVGHLISYKNFLRLLIAFGQSGLGKEFDLRVIAPGQDGFNAEETTVIEKYHLQNSIHLMNNVNEEILRDSYANAVALAFPSEYEGFGFPVLETMAGGTLVAASNTSSLPEVGGDVAFYFDPYDTDSIADCLLRVVQLSSEERRERIDRGIARAREFTWERCVWKTVQVFGAI